MHDKTLPYLFTWPGCNLWSYLHNTFTPAVNGMNGFLRFNISCCVSLQYVKCINHPFIPSILKANKTHLYCQISIGLITVGQYPTMFYPLSCIVIEANEAKFIINIQLLSWLENSHSLNVPGGFMFDNDVYVYN